MFGEKKKRICVFQQHVEFWLFVLEKILFDLAYIFCFSPKYGYCGAILDIHPGKMLVGWGATLALLAASEKIQHGVLSTWYKLFIAISAIPSLAVYGLKGEPNRAFVLLVLYWGIFGMAILFFDKCQKDYKGEIDTSEWLRENRWILTALFIWLVLSSLFFSGKYGAFRLFVNFQDVYRYRLDESTQMNGLLAYIFGWNTAILLPLCLLGYLTLRKYIQAIVLVVMSFMCYSIAGNKVILMYMLMAAGIYLIWKLHVQRYFLYIMQIAINLFLLVGTVLVLKNNTAVITAFAYRIFSIPAEEHYYYYDFFQKNEFLFLRQSVLRKWFQAPYAEEVSKIIGSSPQYFLTGNYNNASNGLFSTAYGNFGFLGVVLAPICIVATASLLLRITRKWDNRIRVYLMMYSCLYLISASYTSWLLTGGVVVLMLVCGCDWLWNRIVKV